MMTTSYTPDTGVRLDSHDQPLCPDLYAALRHWSGRPVLIANPGEGIAVVMGAGGREEVTHPGETYRVCCPYCGDTRHRLYVNHRWYEYRFLAICFNEQCFKDPDTRRLFASELIFRVGSRAPFVMDAPPPEPEDLTISVEPPGIVRSLHQVEHSHPAAEYVRSRRFDPAYLSAVFAVGVCDGSQRHPAMTGRIYVPVFDGERMAGWQGRAAFDAPPNPQTGKPDWKALGVTKYYNRPGFRKSRHLYGPYRDHNHPFVILVEGVTDAWRVGPSARAYLGIEMSDHQRAIVGHRWGKSGGVVVCMGDGEAQEKNDRQAMMLEHELARHGCRVVKVTLPAKCDPGSLTYDQNWSYIEAATAAVYCPIRRPSP